MVKNNRQIILQRPPLNEEQDIFDKKLSLLRQAESLGRQAKGELNELKKLVHFPNKAKERFSPLELISEVG